MAANTGLSGFGTVLSRGGTAIGDAYTAIADVIDLNHGGYKVTELDATHLTSPSGVKESIPGMVDPGQFDFDLNWNPDTATHDTLQDDVTTVPQTVRYWKVEWAPSSAPSETWRFQGYVSKYAPKAPHDGKMTAALTLKVTGPITRS